MWQFRVDRGGTFTDIVARAPGGEVTHYRLLWSPPVMQEFPPSVR